MVLFIVTSKILNLQMMHKTQLQYSSKKQSYVLISTHALEADTKLSLTVADSCPDS